MALADFTALGRRSEEQAVYLLQSLLLDEGPGIDILTNPVIHACP